MPIKPFAIGTIPFLESYIPYEYPNGIFGAELIADMISYNIQPQSVISDINYSVGAESTYGYVMTIKNMTQNANVSVLVESTTNFMKIDPPSMVTLRPLQIYNFTIDLNKTELDAISNFVVHYNDIKITIRNESNGELIVKSPTSIVQMEYLPTSVTVI